MIIPSHDLGSLGYVGKRSDHRDNTERLLATAANPICAINDSQNDGVYSRTPALFRIGLLANFWQRVYRLFCQLNGVMDPRYIREAVGHLEEGKVECLLSFWGLNVMPDVVAIKKHRPQTRVILAVLCHPLGLSKAKIAMQNWLFRRSVSYCDGILVSSNIMKTYLEENVIRGRDIPIAIWPPYLSSYYYPRERLPPCEHHPNLLFLGRMDWWAAQPTDNVTALLGQLTVNGVHVYHHRTREQLPFGPNRHEFGYLPLHEMSVYATQFDASLIAYNLDACGRSDRFCVTIPDRLVASVTAGIPIAIPREGYDASKEFLRHYRAVIEFASPDELSTRLADRSMMKQLRAFAAEDSAHYQGERHLPELLRFIQQVSGRTK